MSDEGMYDFFGSLDDYFRVSPEHADILGWEVIDYPIKDSAEMAFTIMSDDYEQDRTKTVTPGRTINQNRKNTESADNPFPRYKERMRKTLGSLGFEIVKYFGEDSFTKMKESPILKKQDVKKGVDHIKKVQESFMKDVELLIEGGAYGHMNHPFDDNNLTFSDLKNIIIIGLSGKLNREDRVSEKLDGQNLMVSWVDGKLKAARNKGHLKDSGKNAPTTAGIASMFAGRGNIKTAFVGAMRDLEKAIGSLSEAQKTKVFGKSKVSGDTSMTGYTPQDLSNLSNEDWFQMYHPESANQLVSSIPDEVPDHTHNKFKNILWKAKNGIYRVYNIDSYFDRKEGFARAYYYWVNGDIEGQS